MKPWSLIPLWVRALIILAVVGALVGGITWGVHTYNESLREEGRAEVRAAMQAEMQAQKDRNLELQRQAEKHYSVITPVREHYITQTVTEVRHAAESLAACPVPAPAVRLLNDAARCAGKDSAAACGAGDAVRSPE